MVIGLATVFFVGYGFVDTRMMPELAGVLVLVRAVPFAPIAVAAFAVTYYPRLRWVQNVLVIALVLSATSSMTLMALLTPEEMRYSYYLGFMVAFLFGYILAGLRFTTATIVGWSSVLMFNIAELAFGNATPIVLLNVNYVFVAANLAGMFASYALEYAARREFMRNRELSGQRRRLARLNEQLEHRVRERTQEAVAATERLAYLAHHDSLTGIPNRRGFEEGLHSRIQAGDPFALIYADVDRFKTVNDSLGHHLADEVLQELARRLVDVVREDDMVARLGGDEFVVMLHGTDGEDLLDLVVSRLMIGIGKPITVEGQTVQVSISMGAAFFPEHADDDVSIIRCADSALLTAKENGRNQLCLYSPRIGAFMSRRANVERLLSGALERDEFFLHYQPKLDPASGRVQGLEALLRWESREGPISPAIFVPIAEEIGAIREIGQWVFRRALEECSALCRSVAGEFVVSVNLSSTQFNDASFLQVMDAELKAAGVAAERLRIEIVESSLMTDLDLARDTLDGLRGVGVSVSIDDFGTGYSSLAYLTRLPIDEIKIDKAFVRNVGMNPEDDAIVRSIVLLGKALGLSVVAEGVETAKQLAFLQEVECDLVQGYYFARPAAFPQLQLEIRDGAAYLISE